MNLCIKNYALNLSDGNNWCITCDEQNIQMLNNLSVIMDLRECLLDNRPKLIFAKMEDEKRIAGNNMFPSLSLLDHDTKWVCYNPNSQTIRIWFRPDMPDVICEINDTQQESTQYLNMRCALLAIYKRSVNFGGIPVHAGLAEIDGRGVVFAGPGGIGKSTCCRRLPHYWKPLCDDEALIVLNSKGKYQVHPFPTWSEYLRNISNKTWDVQYSVPLSAIFFLEQAKSDEIMPLCTGQSAVFMTDSSFQVCLYPMILAKSYEELIEFRKRLFNNAFDIAASIPSFRLKVSLTGKFWEEIEKVLGL